jgi:cytochrome c peroxidase
MRKSILSAILFSAIFIPGLFILNGNAGTPLPLTPKQQLGKRLFMDKNLSTPPGQSCESCHSPQAAFADPQIHLPVSQGAHRTRFGNRNDLTAMYAAFIPELKYNEQEEVYEGGLFWDGRVNSLEEQAKGPPLNPLEMANPKAENVIAAIRESDYVNLFKSVFGNEALDDSDKAFDYFAEAVAAYERSDEFNPFTSKYDYYLQGKVKLSEEEFRGLSLFNDESKGNCAACHPNERAEDGSLPLFTDFTYDNLGVPKNPENPFYYLPKDLNPDGVHFVDLGLGGFLNKKEENGKFRVPTLRNIAITSPYMHNGVFKTLYQVIAFYNTRDIGPWPQPEVADNVNKDELGNLGLTEQEELDLVIFLNTLSDGYALE